MMWWKGWVRVGVGGVRLLLLCWSWMEPEPDVRCWVQEHPTAGPNARTGLDWTGVSVHLITALGQRVGEELVVGVAPTNREGRKERRPKFPLDLIIDFKEFYWWFAKTFYWGVGDGWGWEWRYSKISVFFWRWNVFVVFFVLGEELGGWFIVNCKMCINKLFFSLYKQMCVILVDTKHPKAFYFLPYWLQWLFGAMITILYRELFSVWGKIEGWDTCIY